MGHDIDSREKRQIYVPKVGQNHQNSDQNILTPCFTEKQ
jgi:hypothetical protein